MKDEFEHRWKVAAAAGRSADADPEPSVPFGFTARVLALSRERGAGPSLTALWQKLAGRTLGGLAIALAIIVAVELWPDTASTPLRPMVEQSVEEQIFWLPS